MCFFDLGKIFTNFDEFRHRKVSFLFCFVGMKGDRLLGIVNDGVKEKTLSLRHEIEGLRKEGNRKPDL